MKKTTLVAAFGLVTVLSAQAALFYEGTGVGTGTSLGGVANPTIVDGSGIGVYNSMDLSSAGLGHSLVDIKVTLNISGGANSDLYGYLSYNGTMVVLLNRIGISSGNAFGNSDAGFNVTLDSSSANIHNTAGGIAGSTYSADGQNISPYSSAGSFNVNGSSSITLDNTFGGMDPNGTWTLYFADVVHGDGDATINGWSLDITAVPEPVNVALGMFAGMAVVMTVARQIIGKQKSRVLTLPNQRT
jgi:hypothetical protein